MLSYKCTRTRTGSVPPVTEASIVSLGTEALYQNTEVDTYLSMNEASTGMTGGPGRPLDGPEGWKLLWGGQVGLCVYTNLCVIMWA